jgi:AraC-like DNA-binding protein
MPLHAAFDPLILQWWSLLSAQASRIQQVAWWPADAHGPDPANRGQEAHHTPTLVLCLAGAVRIEDRRDRCDLAVGEALIIAAGAWHRHAPLRPGAVCYRQGVVGGRSDFFLHDHAQTVVASVPEQPCASLLERAASPLAAQRRQGVRDLLATVLQERAAPLDAGHRAVLAMEYALWDHLHQRDAMRRILAASGLARAQAYRVFSAHFAAGISSVLRRERLTLARRLLASGLGVAEVAERCGFASRGTFTRAYRQAFAVPPSAAT